VRRGGRIRRGARRARSALGTLCALAVAAVLLHLGFDALNDYGIRLLLPFTDRWYYGDIIFVVDPWFWLLLGGGAHLAMPRGGIPEALAWAGWAILSIPVLFDSSPPMPARVVWLLGLLALAALRFGAGPRVRSGRGPPSRRSRSTCSRPRASTPRLSGPRAPRRAGARRRP
jgi:inner membrane protein